MWALGVQWFEYRHGHDYQRRGQLQPQLLGLWEFGLGPCEDCSAMVNPDYSACLETSGDDPACADLEKTTCEGRQCRNACSRLAYEAKKTCLEQAD